MKTFLVLLLASFPALASQEKDSITLIVRDPGSFNELHAIVSTFSGCSIQTGTNLDQITLDAQCAGFSSYTRSLGVSSSAVNVAFSIDDSGSPIEGVCRLMSIDSTGNKTRYTLECRHPVQP